MGDTIRNTTDTSESSLGNEAPPLRNSRQKQFRTKRRLRGAALKKRELSWQNRLVQRLQEKNLSASSDDEGDTCPSVLASIAKLPEQEAAVGAPAALRSAENRAKLRKLPRPSEIVPDLEDGSTWAAGLSAERKEAYQRRITSTELRLQYLNLHGAQQFIPKWKRERGGLHKYNDFGIPPKEDQFIEQYRVPKALLSRAYRGTLLAVRKDSQKSRRRKSRKCPEGQRPAAELSSGVSDHVSIVDCEHWTTTSDSDIAILKSSGEADDTSTKEQQKRKEKNAELVKQVLAEIGSNTSNSEGSNGCEDSDRLPGPPPVEETPRQENGDDLFGMLFTMASENPAQMFEEVDKMPELNAGAPAAETEKGGGHSQEDDTKKEKELENLPKFELEKRKALIFCLGREHGKRSRSTVEAEVLQPERKKQKHEPQHTVAQSAPKVSHMMEKMGFKGRLGANETGLLEPLEAHRRKARSGIGSKNAAERVAGGQPFNLGPVSFTGKQNAIQIPEAIAPTPAHSGSVDKYGSRKKAQSGAAAYKSEVGSDVATESETLKNARKKDLDENDVFETDREDVSIDNGRRAVLVDVDALIWNSRQRRLSAFKKMVQDSDCIASDFDVHGFLQNEKMDLCDADCVSSILDACGLERSDEMCDKIQDELDQAFKAVEEVHCNVEIVDILKKYSRDVYLGLFHRGSRGRLNHELSSLGLAYSFLGGPRATVKHGDSWPYVATWQDLLCRVGVRARQSLFWVGEEDFKGILTSGVVAGAILGARTMVTLGTEQGVKMRMGGLRTGETEVELSATAVRDDRSAFFEPFLKNARNLVKRRRVLALYSADGLWYCGWEEFGQQHSGASGHGRSLIRFQGYDNEEWVENDNVIPLERKHFRRIRDSGFPGILEPDDVADL